MTTSTSTHLLEQGEALLRKERWPALERIRNTVFERVLEGFIQNGVGEEHFTSVSGYGHDDLGRAAIDRVFAHALQAEAALVRPHFVSGTHALATALRGCLSPGDTLLSLTGHPYDTLEEVIGIRGNDPQSLKRWGVDYQVMDTFDGEVFRLPGADDPRARHCSVAYIQRSRGYSLRQPLSIEDIRGLCAWVRRQNPDATILVDNCYGEFTEAQEPTAAGADLMAGSLIKNPGGGIVPAGGYIAGRRDLVERCATALTAPGIGAEGGYMFNLNRLILQGLYLAPGMVYEALKGMTAAAWLFEELGYRPRPGWQATRGDIIQAVELEAPEKLIAFCRLIQAHSPVDAKVTPEPSPVPGYADPVIMAGGTFIQGATLELSADGPLRPPYAAFLQGGLTYAHTRLILKKVLAEGKI